MHRDGEEDRTPGGKTRVRYMKLVGLEKENALDSATISQCQMNDFVCLRYIVT